MIFFCNTITYIFFSQVAALYFYKTYIVRYLRELFWTGTITYNLQVQLHTITYNLQFYKFNYKTFHLHPLPLQLLGIDTIVTTDVGDAVSGTMRW